MPWSALPEHLNSPEKWKGTDMDTFLWRWTLKIKGWFAFGPRAKEWWARWRPVPVDIFKINDGTEWRYEIVNDLSYTSRVQYWSRWHLLIQWPLSISFHFYWKKKEIPGMGIRPNELGLRKMLFLYGPRVL